MKPTLCLPLLPLALSACAPDPDFGGGDDGTDTIDEEDLFYEGGGWPIATCQDEIVPTGNLEGDIAEDFSLMDQFGEQVRLHDFCDRAVYIIAGAFW